MNAWAFGANAIFKLPNMRIDANKTKRSRSDCFEKITVESR
jgi:hypothetical protein